MELVTGKLIMSPDWSKVSILKRQIDHPKHTALATCTITLDDILQNDFKYSFCDDVIYGNCSSVRSETKKQHSQCIEL